MANGASSGVIATPFNTTLATFVANAFFGVIIQDDDDIAHTVLNRDWSPDVIENDAGTPLDFAQFEKIVFSLRAQITNRYLDSQNFVVTPADDLGRTGSIGHTAQFSGIQDGKNVKITSVGVLKVGIRAPAVGKGGEGTREILTESFVVQVVPA